MISIGPLFIILLIHSELVKWTRRFLLVTVAALWLRIVSWRLQKITSICPYPLEKFMTRNKQSAPDDQHGTTVHHSCDPLGAGEMDQEVLAGHCGRLVVEDCGLEAKKHLILPHSLEKFMTHHKQSAPDDQHRTTVHHVCDPLGAGEMDQQVLAGQCGRLVVEDCGSESPKNHLIFAPRALKNLTRHKQSAPDDQHRTTVHHSCDLLRELVKWTSRFLLVNVAALC
jgi:hypothetical protein